MTLITPDTISFTDRITEDELRARMTVEVLESIGALDADGKPHPGIRTTVHRGDGRKGGYTINVSGPAPARLRLPKPENGDG